MIRARSRASAFGLHRLLFACVFAIATGFRGEHAGTHLHHTPNAVTASSIRNLTAFNLRDGVL